MRLKSIPLAISVVAILFGGIAVTTAMSWWQTESTKVPAVYTEGEAAGQFNPADIRGSYTFGDINKNFGIPLANLQTAFRLPAGADTAAFQVKSLEGLYAGLPVEMGTGAVRLFTAFYNGLPYDLTANADTFLFPEAAAVLRTNGRMTPDQAEFLSAHIVAGEGQPAENAVETPAPEANLTPAPAATEHTAPVGSLTGKTTFQQLLDWGMTRETIEEVLGVTMPDAAMTVKDYAASKGLEFSALKTDFQTRLDSAAE